jgi:hypothetical protein
MSESMTLYPTNGIVSCLFCGARSVRECRCRNRAAKEEA